MLNLLRIVLAAARANLKSRRDRARWWPDWRRALILVKPATVIAWHRKGFALYWARKSRQTTGRPSVRPEIRCLFRRMAGDNIGWGAPRIHGELLKLGLSVSEATVSRYMPRRRPKPPSQTWRTFLRNHMHCAVGIDFFVVPTATFRLLYVFIVLDHARRRIMHVNVTDQPTARWAAQQVIEAFAYDTAPRYLHRDRDSIYGGYFKARIRGMGIDQGVSAPRAPWQNPYVERVIGSIRRECTTTSSSSVSVICGRFCGCTSTTTTPTAHMTRSAKTLLTSEPPRRPNSETSSPCHASVVFIISTKDALHEVLRTDRRSSREIPTKRHLNGSRKNSAPARLRRYNCAMEGTGRA